MAENHWGLKRAAKGIAVIHLDRGGHSPDQHSPASAEALAKKRGADCGSNGAGSNEASLSEEYRLRLQIRQVETGECLAKSHDLPGLVAQGRTVAETAEISHDVVRKFIESCREHGDPLPEGLHPMDKAGIELAIPVGA